MGLIAKYKGSTIFTINIKYGKEKINFNLAKELKFTPEAINGDLKTQPTKYGFCLLLHKSLLTEFEKAKADRKRIWGKLYFKAKEQKSNGRPYSDELCKAYVEKHPNYIKASTRCIEVKDWADKMFSCIRAFEQRKDLMQTISSNMRQEK